MYPMKPRLGEGKHKNEIHADSKGKVGLEAIFPDCCLFLTRSREQSREGVSWDFPSNLPTQCVGEEGITIPVPACTDTKASVLCPGGFLK